MAIIPVYLVSTNFTAWSDCELNITAFIKCNHYIGKLKEIASTVGIYLIYSVGEKIRK